jgi:hypothetical protein
VNWNGREMPTAGNTHKPLNFFAGGVYALRDQINMMPENKFHASSLCDSISSILKITNNPAESNPFRRKVTKFLHIAHGRNEIDYFSIPRTSTL